MKPAHDPWNSCPRSPGIGAHDHRNTQPDSRNHRKPTGCDTPTDIAASSLESPSATKAQNRRRCSCRATGGRPGDRNLSRKTRSERRRPAIAPVPLPRCCDDQLDSPNMSPFATPGGWRKQASSLRSAVSATAMTTRSRRPSTGSTKPRSSIGRGLGRTSTPSSLRPWNGWTGSTIEGSWRRSGISPPAETEARYYAALEQPALTA